MPFIAEADRIVSCSPEAAFDRLADHASWFVWMPASFRPVGESLGTLRVGLRPRVRIARVPIANPLEVVVAVRGKELTWTGGNGLLRGSHRFLFEAVEGGKTRIRSVETWDGLLSPLLKLAVKPMAEKVGREQLDALARAIGP